MAAGQKYGDADGYDAYMGGWSAALSPLFLDFVGFDGAHVCVLDVGCGTGNLLAEVARRYPATQVTGIDPSPVLLKKARGRGELARATLLESTIEALPLRDGNFDAVFSMLVLQEFPDRHAALLQMIRATRIGGIVAACQWDFARMPIIDALVEATASIDPSAGARVSSSTPAAFADVSELAAVWKEMGLSGVSAGRIAVSRTFGSFGDLWSPLLAGSTPSTLALASLPNERRQAVHDRMRTQLGAERSSGSITITAEAMVVVGTRR
jgi:SAM-dependent methyltransferase